MIRENQAEEHAVLEKVNKVAASARKEAPENILSISVRIRFQVSASQVDSLARLRALERSVPAGNWQRLELAPPIKELLWLEPDAPALVAAPLRSAKAFVSNGGLFCDDPGLGKTVTGAACRAERGAILS